MDVFKFAPSDTIFAGGELVNGITRKTWIERYRDAGEFTFEAPIDSGVREALPTGSFVSHVDSREIMMVENHELSEDRGATTSVVITGRSYETIMEERIVGSNQPTFPSASPPPPYNLAAAYTWNQAVVLMRDHIIAAYTNDDDNALGNITVNEAVGGTGVFLARTIKRNSLYSELMDLLAIENLGIRSYRDIPGFSSSEKCYFTIHQGVDRSDEISFTEETGEIDSADYLWSIKSIKNAVLLTGRWLETRVVGPETGIDRRWMFIDCSDLDNSYTAAPTGTTRTNLLNAMTARGNAALAAQKETALIKVEARPDAKRYVYREDFDLGDIVTVRGQYSETAQMRIVEYVETEDETGENGQPTFAAL